MRRMVLPVSIALALLARVSHQPFEGGSVFFREQSHHPYPQLASSVLEGF